MNSLEASNGSGLVSRPGDSVVLQTARTRRFHRRTAEERARQRRQGRVLEESAGQNSSVDSVCLGAVHELLRRVYFEFV